MRRKRRHKASPEKTKGISLAFGRALGQDIKNLPKYTLHQYSAISHHTYDTTTRNN